ncbi:hypothetical protein Tco_1404158 [Tanacetum coccineum]
MIKTLTLKAINSLLCMSLEAEGKSTLLKRHPHSYLSQSCQGSAMLGISFMSFLFRCVRPGHSLNRFPSELVEERQVVKKGDFEEFDGIDEVARILIGKVRQRKKSIYAV